MNTNILMIIISFVAIVILSGCGNETVMNDNSVYIKNGDGTVTYISGDNNFDNAKDLEDNLANDMTGDFDEDFDASTCKLNGYFFCPITGKCTEQPASGSSCRG